jgi:hypothetical protein
MDTLIGIVISGLAVSFTIEYINTLTGNFFNPAIVRMILTLPLAFIACWYLDITSFTLVVAAPAAGLVSVAVTQLVTKPASVTQVVPRRR